MSDYEKVAEWTAESSGNTLPKKPRRMTKREVGFIIEMVFDELVELATTVDDNPIEFAKSCINIKKLNPPPMREEQVISEQADALMDTCYYIYNAAAKAGVNLTDVFHIVHAANENKRFPDGSYHRNESGKVIKPVGWMEPDVESVIHNQMTHGSWSK